MKRCLSVAGLILLFIFLLPKTVEATSQQAYQDYLYQSDLYRSKYNDFKVARNEYQKFNTLTSQTTALTKTRDMLTQRNALLKSYLLLLNEKINETTGMTETDKSYYRSLINNENSWLTKNNELIPSIGSLEDANNVSQFLENHYNILLGSMLQIVSAISLGNLNGIANQYDQNLADAKALVNSNRGIFTPQKQSLLDRWLLQITNVRSLYQGKADEIKVKISKLKGVTTGYTDPASLFSDSKKILAEGRQYLLEGSSYLAELTREIKYQN